MLYFKLKIRQKSFGDRAVYSAPPTRSRGKWEWCEVEGREEEGKAEVMEGKGREWDGEG